MQKLLVFTHKTVWRSVDSPTGWATDGGFVFHMAAIGSLFDEVEIWAPIGRPRHQGEVCFKDPKLKITPINVLGFTAGPVRKPFVVLWGLINYFRIRSRIKQADVVHVPIPSDLGTVGMWIAHQMKKPLFVRHCGNWGIARTGAERYWKSFMTKYAGNGVAALATGGSTEPPTSQNPNVKWIFSTSLLDQEMQALAGKRRGISFDQGFRLITVSRQVKKKGTGTVIKAMAILEDKSYTLDVIGEGKDLESFKALAKELGVADQVIFHGKLNNRQVLDALGGAHLFCYPTEASEGFPKVVMEAMANGLPVITTAVSVLPSLIGDTQAGEIIGQSAPEELAGVISKLRDNQSLWSKYSQNALREVKKYSLEAWASEIAKHLSQHFAQEFVPKRAILK